MKKSIFFLLASFILLASCSKQEKLAGNPCGCLSDACGAECACGCNN